MPAVWRHLRLGQKVTLVVLASFIPLVLLGIQVANFSGRLLREQTLDNVGLAARVEAGRVQGEVDGLIAELDEIVGGSDFSQLLLQQTSTTQAAGSNLALEQTTALAMDKYQGGGMLGFELRIVGGNTYRAGALTPQSELEAQAIAPDEELRVGSVFFVEGQPRLTVVRHVWVDSAREGQRARATSEWNLVDVLGAGLDVSEFGQRAEVMYLAAQPDGSLRVVDSTDVTRRGQQTTFLGNPVAGGEAVVMETRGFDGTDVVQASSRVGNPPWITVIEADPEHLFASLDRIRIFQAAVFVGAGLVIIAVVVLASRSFVRRLAKVTDLAEAVADGDLTVRTGDSRSDELGRLSMAFDDMAEALAHDIARRERVEAQLAYQATHDALTGLPNRQQLIEELDRLLVDSEDFVSVLFVDLDGFKAVNDRLGHGAGDELLVRVGDRLRGVLRQNDFVARLGGDEFVVVLRGLGLLEAERTAERIVGALELPFIVSDDECSVSASIGVASANDDRSSERLIKEADIAMYRAKALGKGRAVRVTPEALTEVDERVSVLGELREAISKDQFQLMLWPVHDLRTGGLVGTEATIRWHHPIRGELAPADFLPFAVSSGFAGQIDEWVMERAINQFADWAEEGLPVADLEMSINLTPEMFLSPRSRQLLTAEMGRRHVSVNNFRIEVPETVLRSDGTQLREVFDTYRVMGMPVTLDRFGTDYSNLDRLPRFALDAVKVDLTLISGLSNRLSSRALVSSLITLAQTAGLRVSAAGVDDEMLRDQLVELGCYVGQGLWFSGPISPDDFADLIRSRYLLEAG